MSQCKLLHENILTSGSQYLQTFQQSYPCVKVKLTPCNRSLVRKFLRSKTMSFYPSLHDASWLSARYELPHEKTKILHRQKQRQKP